MTNNARACKFQPHKNSYPIDQNLPTDAMAMQNADASSSSHVTGISYPLWDCGAFDVRSFFGVTLYQQYSNLLSSYTRILDGQEGSGQTWIHVFFSMLHSSHGTPNGIPIFYINFSQRVWRSPSVWNLADENGLFQSLIEAPRHRSWRQLGSSQRTLLVFDCPAGRTTDVHRHPQKYDSLCFC